MYISLSHAGRVRCEPDAVWLTLSPSWPSWAQGPSLSPLLLIQLQGHPGLGDSVLLQLLLHLHHSLPITDHVFLDHTSPLPLRERLTSIRSLILVRYRDNLCKKTRKINNILISDISSSVYLKKIQLNFSTSQSLPLYNVEIQFMQ